MDQDFHYYGTFHSAMSAGFGKDDATLIAKASNFIDFFHEDDYASNWSLVSETEKSPHYNVVAKMEYPRYTFQHGYWSTFKHPEDSVWCTYHFIPGNYDDPAGTPSREDIHGVDVASYIPRHIKRDTRGGEYILRKYNIEKLNDLLWGRMLNRPQSALSRRLIQDTVLCVGDEGRLEKIISLAAGGAAILGSNRSDVIHRFKLILLGIRAHVIADTWAHQDHCGLDNVMNTYWDVNYDPDSWNPLKFGLGRQSIDYNDGSFKGWNNTVLTVGNSTVGYVLNALPGHNPLDIPNSNFEATPNSTSYLGHGWLGHFPDFSSVKFRYKPCWSDPRNTIERDNPKEYEAAWVELTSLFYQAKTGRKLEINEQVKSDISKARQAIETPCDLAKFIPIPGRVTSQKAWQKILPEQPGAQIDTLQEPDSKAVLGGVIERKGTSYVNIQSDLYLFQIAADYHFHFIKHYLKANGIYQFTGEWSKQRSTLSDAIVNLFE
ncbi:DUF6765 family protein [Pseudomonas vanderleydeniana]|uniref:Uncharacterized protein n=1 Tax=Pseudomonas vanderleydeniana TaxID=2745495 RepID=A0A9E6PH91_9PSED|nr:DUF6765 family protein [Pseudomonas vanderleydeniana]QXI26185.1 hypothetical protein HU752_019725 [Pseudomonas vanderleydeniana]